MLLASQDKGAKKNCQHRLEGVESRGGIKCSFILEGDFKA